MPGQVCVSTQRIFVYAEIQAEFVERFAARRGRPSLDPRADEAITTGWGSPLLRRRLNYLLCSKFGDKIRSN
jgi:hypothetical protein